MRLMLQFGALLKDMYGVAKKVPRATLFLSAGLSWRLPWTADFYALQWFRGSVSISYGSRRGFPGGGCRQV